MSARIPPLCAAVRTLFRAPFAYALVLPLALTGCGGGGSNASTDNSGSGETDNGSADTDNGSGGSDEETTQALDTEAAREVMGQRLKDVQQGVSIEAGFSPLVSLSCDNLGEYTSDGVAYRVCQIYDAAGPEGVPTRSPDGVDLVSRIPGGDADAVLAAVDADLQQAQWAPVLRTGSLDFGNFEVDEAITGEFRVRGARPEQLSGRCTIGADDSDITRSVELNRLSTEGRTATLGFDLAAGSGLISGQYTLDCTFTSPAADTEVDETARVQILAGNLAPDAPAGVSLVDEASLLTDPDGRIRDVNASAFCVEYTDPGSDPEDSRAGLSVAVEGFYEIGGEQFGPVDIGEDRRYCIDIADAGGQTVEAGFRSRDSGGALSELAAIARTIDRNEAPGITQSNFPGSFSCTEGACDFPALSVDACDDPEGDVVTARITRDGTMVASGTPPLEHTPGQLAAGTYSFRGQCEDEFDSQGDPSAEYVFEIAPTDSGDGSDTGGGGGISS